MAGAGHEQIVIAPGPQENWTKGFDSAARHSTGQMQVPRFDEGPVIRRLAGPRLPYDPSYALLWNIAGVRREIRALAPDVLEAHSPYVAAAATLGAQIPDKVVRTFVWHSDFVDTNAEVLRGLVPRAARLVGAAENMGWRWARRLTQHADATLVAARWQKQKLESQGCARVHLLPFGVDTNTFSPEKRSETVRAAQLTGCDSGAKLVVAIGRMAVEKHWDGVFEAFRLAREAGANARLLALGDGPERVALERRYGHLPDVSFLGFEKDRAQLACLLASSDVLLHACPYETFGLGVAEALASGLLGVLPDQGGAAEFADGDRVLSYRSGEAAEAAKLLRIQLGRPYDGKRGFSRSEHSHFDALLALYTELGAQRASGGISTR